MDVKEQVTAQFERNTREVTKKFYREFSAQHKDFLKFIKGIQEKVDQEWYASLMLNRLMFIYFIQKKGFLNDDCDYLQTKLKDSKQKRGENKFYTFYRDFLLVLFHQGLGSPKRDAALLEEIGKVPYLNGGLFDVHDLEKNHPIEIGDKAFENLFAFFDTWNWHLDTRASSSGRDVNPDVIGYIFEQYINDRAQMGAYYTKEDITEYISKNTIIPWLFDEARRKDAQAFKPEGGVWKLLRDDPDKYIYPSVRHGISPDMVSAIAAEPADTPWYRSALFSDLPAEVRAGLDPEQKDLWKIRKDWNVRAPEAIALPTEIYRELIDRRRRYLDVHRKLVAGEVTAINDLITYNLDIRQFAQDVIHEYEGSDLVGAFYDAISRITVLDPTCGSGAFLFAALGILQPLYEECLDRMQWFVEVDNEKGSGRKHPEFRKVLERMQQHTNRDYFIYKSIILQNLYGVDIMREAVEIAKLRLFLKLVSTVDPDPRQENYGIEPLPDIDFNIRSGNTLVGFATKAEVKKISEWSLDFDTAEQDRVEEKCDVVDKAFERYKEIQLNEGEDYQTFRQAKDELYQRLAALRDELDVYLAKSYSITDLPKQQKQFDAWKASHTPFHWFAEYYGIVHQRGGFDVIIGNPPYVEYSTTTAEYGLKNYDTLPSGNLYAYVTERSHRLLNTSGFLGLIVPMSISSIRDFSTLRAYVAKNFPQSWLTNHAIRPQSLFTGVAQRVSILIGDPSSKKASSYSTKYLRVKDSIKDLFQNIDYVCVTDVPAVDTLTPKIGSPIERAIWLKISAVKRQGVALMPRPTQHVLFVKDYGETYWIFPFSFKPYLTPVKSYKELYFQTSVERDALFVASNSSLFYWFYTAVSDCWHFGKWHLTIFPFVDGVSSSLVPLAAQLKNSLLDNRITRFDERINGNLYEYKVSRSKSILDEIDVLLSAHYGLSSEELDYIINYDIKYRMGDELEGSDDKMIGRSDDEEPTPAKRKKAEAPAAKAAKATLRGPQGATLRQAQGEKKDAPDPFG